MEGIKGGGKVGVGEGFEVFDNGTQCINHPHRNSPGGICAFCLQEKLGKLVSSSFPLPIHPSSSSSSSTPSFRSHHTAATSSSSSSLPLSAPQKNHSHHDHVHASRLPFLLAKKKKKPCSNNPSSSTSDVVFKRSKSTATPRMGKFLNEEDFSPRKKNKFWSFLYLSSSKHSASCSSKFEAKSFSNSNGSPRISTLKHKDKNNFGSSLGRKSDMVMVVEEDNVVVSPNNGHSSSLDRKVSRSRSVGCGSRSFSGDFFERISTGLGDCTLRRVESQREGSKSKVGSASHCMKERVRCGGLFGGFMMMTSSSTSSSSASSYWISSSSADDGINGDSLSHGKGRSWGWTLASPMRAFSSKNSSKDNKRGSSVKNPTPNLSAIPSLLTVRS
ncbi:uncharacterized protein LOC130724241 [Lotus japonicus]|uniref:uncharacterized protein LOC130724241 n=1 Tax=Lotus japonicus TaxID=34305 RepID=UPI002587D242|nr:uncharacterized protein LOC130724241 [Lotus japonicus]